MHKSWMEDIALRLLCVIALDRFGDFVSDQVFRIIRMCYCYSFEHIDSYFIFIYSIIQFIQ